MDTHITHLNNGIKCLLVRDPSSPKFTFTIQFKVGSRFENEQNSGVAHLLEHMIFKGTKSNPDPKKLAFKIENLGAHVNAWTSKELTSYYISCPKRNWAKAVELLSEMIKEPIFSNGELNKEKLVIAQEIKMYEDDPPQKAFDLFMNKLFLDHPLGRNIAGELKTLSKLKSNDCFEFIKNNYNNANLLLIVSGPFDRSSVLRKLEKEFSNFNESTTPKYQPFKKVESTDASYHYKKELKQMHIVMGSYAYSYKELKKTKWEFNLGKVILSGGFGSELIQRIREDLALAYYIDFSSGLFDDTGYYTLQMGVDPSKKQMAIIETEKVLNDFVKGAFKKEEIERAKNYLIGGMITFFETSSDLAMFYANQLQFENNIESPSKVIERIRSIKKDEILSIWEPVLTKDKICVFLGVK